MESIALTNEQANFIYTLTKFTIDSDALRTDCSASQKIVIHGYKFCIKGGAKNESIIKRTRASALRSSSDTFTASSAPDSSSDTYPFGADASDPTATIVVLGCIAGGGVVTAAVKGFALWAKTKKETDPRLKGETATQPGRTESLTANSSKHNPVATADYFRSN